MGELPNHVDRVSRHGCGLLRADDVAGVNHRVTLWPCWDTWRCKKIRRAVRTTCETGTQSRFATFVSDLNIEGETRAFTLLFSSSMWGTMGHNGVWGQVLIVIFFDFFLGPLDCGDNGSQWEPA